MTIIRHMEPAFLYSVRRANLELLKNESGSMTALADSLGRDQGQISKLVNGTLDMGDKLARDIEKKLELESGWLDIPKGINQTIFKDVKKDMNALLESAGVEMDASDLADFYLLSYDLLILHSVDKEHIKTIAEMISRKSA